MLLTKVEVAEWAVCDSGAPGCHQLQGVGCELCTMCKYGLWREQPRCVIDGCVMLGARVKLLAEPNLIPAGHQEDKHRHGGGGG
jgi:hypothetical protein